MKSKLILIFLVIFFALQGYVFSQTKVLFSPKGGVSTHLVSMINESKSSIDLMVYSITYQRLAKALVIAKNRGVKVRLIADESKTYDDNSLVNFLKNNGIHTKTLTGIKNGIMHNKVAIFDAEHLLTGSFNWTYSAENYNYENLIIIDDPEIIKNYQDEFDKLWSKISVPEPKVRRNK